MHDISTIIIVGDVNSSAYNIRIRLLLQTYSLRPAATGVEEVYNDGPLVKFYFPTESSLYDGCELFELVIIYNRAFPKRKSRYVKKKKIVMIQRNGT